MNQQLCDLLNHLSLSKSVIMQKMSEVLNSKISPKSPLSPASEKSRKYDRQLRIWGDHGQYLIEVCSVCLINANTTGTEILKNLVLAGIGSFTIIDGNRVTKDDDNNFFFDTNSVGKNRALVACSNLRELNPDVSGDYIEESAEILLDTDPNLFAKFSVVIISNMYSEKTLSKLSELLYNLNIPLVLAYSLGFFGMIRLQTFEHTTVESHPDSFLEDLRLDKPFKGKTLQSHHDPDLTIFSIQQILTNIWIPILNFPPCQDRKFIESPLLLFYTKLSNSGKR